MERMILQLTGLNLRKTQDGRKDLDDNILDLNTSIFSLTRQSKSCQNIKWLSIPKTHLT